MLHSSTRLKIIPAEIMDSHFIRDLSKRVFDIYGPYDDILTDWFLSGRTVTIIASIGKKKVGFAMLGRPYGDQPFSGVYELLAIAVEHEMHGRGVGALLMTEIENLCRKLKARTLILHTAADNIVAQGLFRKFGFTALGTKGGFYPEGQDAVTMCRHIL